MTTPIQARSNRANASHTTGPRTAAGKVSKREARALAAKDTPKA